MFSDLSPWQKELVYKGLLALIRSGSGVGFATHDQGHPAYRLGATGMVDGKNLGDSPDRNQLYQMLTSLASELGQASSPAVSTWEGFCQLALEGYALRPEMP